MCSPISCSHFMGTQRLHWLSTAIKPRLSSYTMFLEPWNSLSKELQACYQGLHNPISQICVFESRLYHCVRNPMSTRWPGMAVCRGTNTAQMCAFHGAELGLKHEAKRRQASSPYTVLLQRCRKSQEFHIQTWFSRSHEINLSRER